MEGFDANALDELLGLRAKGLRSSDHLPLGYREADKDWLVSHEEGCAVRRKSSSPRFAESRQIGLSRRVCLHFLGRQTRRFFACCGQPTPKAIARLEKARIIIDMKQ